MHVYVNVCAFLSVIYIFIYTYICIYICLYIYTYVYVLNIYTRTFMCYIYIYIYIHKFMCMHVYVRYIININRPTVNITSFCVAQGC